MGTEAHARRQTAVSCPVRWNRDLGPGPLLGRGPISDAQQGSGRDLTVQRQGPQHSIQQTPRRGARAWRAGGPWRCRGARVCPGPWGRDEHSHPRSQGVGAAAAAEPDSAGSPSSYPPGPRGLRRPRNRAWGRPRRARCADARVPHDPARASHARAPS